MFAMDENKDEVISFICEFLSCNADKVDLDTRVGEDLGVYGNDGIDLLNEYAKRFIVDITDFPSEKYFGEESSFNPFYFIYRIFVKETEELRTLYIRDLVDAREKKKLT